MVFNIQDKHLPFSGCHNLLLEICEITNYDYPTSSTVSFVVVIVDMFVTRICSVFWDPSRESNKFVMALGLFTSTCKIIQVSVL